MDADPCLFPLKYKASAWMILADPTPLPLARMISAIIIVCPGVQVAAVCVTQWLRDGIQEPGFFALCVLGSLGRQLGLQADSLLTTSQLPTVPDGENV